MSLTLDAIYEYLRAAGWSQRRPGKLYTWQDPLTGLCGYRWSGALEIQINRDMAARAVELKVDVPALAAGENRAAYRGSGRK